MQNSQKQKNKRLLFSYWDILPLLTLLCVIVAYSALRPKLHGIVPVQMNGAAKRFINTDITVMEFIVIAALFWSIFTLIVSIGKDVMAALLPMRGIVTTGFLLFGFALTLRPILGQAGVGLGLGVYLLSLLIALVLVVIKGDYKAQRVLQSVLLENDPALQAEFWKGGDLFYFNKKDKRLFVPRPHQIDGGLTANLGHKKVWVMYIAASSIPLTASIVMFIFRVLE